MFRPDPYIPADLPRRSERSGQGGEKITSKTRLGVVYYYKSTSRGIYDPAEILYADDRLEVVSFGQNGRPDKSRSEFQGDLSDLDRILGKLFGPPPTHRRQLEFNSSAFFTGELPDMGNVQEV